MCKHALRVSLLVLLLTSCERRGEERPAPAPPQGGSMIVDHQVQTIDGETVSLSSYRGRALLIVNTASECGLTPQYKDLQEIYAEYKDRGLEVLAFPANDFGEQEPGTHEEIKAFATGNFGVTFPLFAKVHALGPDISPLYEALTTKTPEGMRGDIQWNFTKFLVDADGKVVARFEPKTRVVKPRVREAIEAALPKAP
jgi:glutathione peroxidase